jgi:hypothetical protein
VTVLTNKSAVKERRVNQTPTNAVQNLPELTTLDSDEPDEIELREERQKEVVINPGVVYDRTEYNPMDHGSRRERFERRKSRRPDSHAMNGETICNLAVTGMDQEVYQAMNEFTANWMEDMNYVLEQHKFEEDNVEVKNLSKEQELRRKATLALFGVEDEKIAYGMFSDWITHNEVGSYYVDYQKACFVKIGEGTNTEYVSEIGSGFRAVTENVPKNFMEALRHPEWGDAARKEFNDILEKAMIKVDKQIAIEAIARGCDCLTLFPVYEIKERNGVIVRKVRLVADGRHHATAGPTYSSTPGREELFIMLSMIASNDWEWAHVDEDRAFLNADRIDPIPLFARLKGSPDYFQILRALYGLKTSTRDHSIAAGIRLESIGFKRMGLCTCIFEKIVEVNGVSKRVIVYQYVDDYFFTGETKEIIEDALKEFRSKVKTSEVLWNPHIGLGMEFERDREKRVFKITMMKSIERMVKEFLTGNETRVRNPLMKTKYIVHEIQFEKLLEDGDDTALLEETDGKSKYLQLIGCILWICGYRWDLCYVTTYLTWFNNAPRKHHTNVALGVI